MARDLINRYIWLIDTLNRHGKLSRSDINRLWMKSSIGDGTPIPQRTFFHYRRAIEDNFNIDIECDNNGMYYIVQPDSKQDRIFTNWLLDSYAVQDALSDLKDTGDLVMVDDVPSARQFLQTVIAAIRDCTKLKFVYAGFNRSRPEKDIIFSPHFVRLYRQRWYMVGVKEGGGVRTYALDRVTEMVPTVTKFERDSTLVPDEFFRNTLGITTSKADVRTVKIRTTTTQAKYFRALPLHHTQQEVINDTYSIFTYRLKLNYELVHEILSFGSEVQVLEPRELKVMVFEELKNTMLLYSKK